MSHPITTDSLPPAIRAHVKDDDLVFTTPKTRKGGRAYIVRTPVDTRVYRHRRGAWRHVKTY